LRADRGAAHCRPIRAAALGLGSTRRDRGRARTVDAQRRLIDARPASAANPKFAPQLPRVRVANFGFKAALGIIELLVSFDSEVRFGACGKLGRTSESGH